MSEKHVEIVKAPWHRKAAGFLMPGVVTWSLVKRGKSYSPEPGISGINLLLQIVCCWGLLVAYHRMGFPPLSDNGLLVAALAPIWIEVGTLTLSKMRGTSN
jgi:hypothetical protein